MSDLSPPPTASPGTADPTADIPDDGVEDERARQPWLQQEGESDLWYSRLTAFLRMGPRRALLRLYREHVEQQEREAREQGRETKRQKKAGEGRIVQPPGDVPRAWVEQARLWQWRARAALYDAHMATEDEALWNERRRKLRQREFDVAERILDRVEQMLAFSVLRTRTVEQADADGIVRKTTVEPADWRQADIGVLARHASDLGRRATGQETFRGTVLMAAGQLDEATDEELEAIARGASPSAGGQGRAGG